MSVDFEITTLRTRRALLMGAIGGVVASVATLVRAPAVRAGTDGDLVIDDTSTGAGTTVLSATSSNPAMRIIGGAVGIEAVGDIGLVATSDTGPAIVARSEESAGVIGVGPLGLIPEPLVVKPGVYGAANDHPGVYGYSNASHGVRGSAVALDGVYGHTNADGSDPHPAHSPGAGVHGHGGQAGVLGTNEGGFGVQAISDIAPALYASNDATTVAAIVAEGGPGTAIHGHANTGGVNQINIPASPALTGIFGSATLTGVAIAGQSASGLALRAQSSAGHAVRGRGALDGVIGESTGGRSGVVGYSGSGGAAPAGPAKTGVYGEATQDTASRGVSGFTLAGQGVRGEATTGQGVQGQATTGIGVRGNATTGIGVHGESASGPASRGVFGKTSNGEGVRGEATTSGIGVRAVSATGNALDVSGKVKLNRSGIASVPANKDFVDITVPGGIAATAMVFAVMQIKRTGVWVIAARPAWPSGGLLRIYLNKVGSTTAGTPVAWFVLG